MYSPMVGLSQNKPLLDRIDELWNMRQSYEPQAYISRRGYEGKHFTYWSKLQQRIVELPMKKSYLTQLPEVAKQTDAYENFFLSTDFVFTLVPKLLSDDEAVTNAMMLSFLAKDYYTKFRESTIAADFVHFALMDNVSFIEVTPTDDQKNVEYKGWDFFDILFNPRIKQWGKQREVIKIVRKNVDDLKRSTLYTLPNDFRPSGSSNQYTSMQDVYYQEKFNNYILLGENETLVFECFKLNDEDDHLEIIAIDPGGNELRHDHYHQIKKIPIIPLRIYSGEWYQPSFVFREIPMNRSIDVIANRFEDLILRLAKGGWVVHEEEEIDGGMNEEMGQIIRYTNKVPEPITMPQVPPFLMEWFSSMIQMSERYGMSSIMQGGMPGKASQIRSNKMIDSLKGQTQENNTAPLNNYRAAVKQVLEMTFMFLYHIWDTPQEVIYSDMGQVAPMFISDKYKEIYPEAIGIPTEFKRFDVDVDNGMGNTIEARQENAINLFKLGIIKNPDTVKKVFEQGLTGYLMEAENAPLTDHPEFQQLIKNYPNMTPEQQQSMQQTLGMLAQQTGNQLTGKHAASNAKPLVQQLMAGGTGGGGQPPAPPSPQQQPPPQMQPQGGGM